jgi:hypothetical protein
MNQDASYEKAPLENYIGNETKTVNPQKKTYQNFWIRAKFK